MFINKTATILHRLYGAVEEQAGENLEVTSM